LFHEANITKLLLEVSSPCQDDLVKH
jgi:hypothetical protein